MPYSHLAPRSPHASKTSSFFVGVGQMCLIAINNRNMTNGNLVFLFFFTILNTWVIVKIVRMVIHSTKWEIWAYMIGSAAGAELGVIIHHYFIKPSAFFHLATFIR